MVQTTNQNIYIYVRSYGSWFQADNHSRRLVMPGIIYAGIGKTINGDHRWPLKTMRGEQTILRCLFWRCGSRKEMPPPGIQTWKFDIWRFITGKIIYKWWIFQQASKPCLITGEYNVLQRFRFASWSDIKGGLKQLSKIVNTLKESHMCHTVRFEASHLDLRNEEAQLHQENMFFNAKMSQNSSRSQRTKVQVSTSPW